MNGNLEGSLWCNTDNGNLCFVQDEVASSVIIDALGMVICGEEFKKEDFNILKIIVNERRENMYSFYRVYFIKRESLEWEVQYGIGKTEVSAVNEAHQASHFRDIDLDDLTYKTELIMSFEKKKKLKDAVDAIKEALSDEE